ncbi:MAG: hypothetical protein ACI9GW_001990, partial [Halieaceae bacterium]
VEVKSSGYTGYPQEPCYKPLTNRDHSTAYQLIYGR